MSLLFMEEAMKTIKGKSFEGATVVISGSAMWPFMQRKKAQQLGAK